MKVFDATNTTRERREMILNFAIDNSYKVSYKIFALLGLTLKSLVCLILSPIWQHFPASVARLGGESGPNLATLKAAQSRRLHCIYLLYISNVKD